MAAPELLHKKRKDYRVVIGWLTAVSVACVLALAAFMTWYISQARAQWFERERMFAEHGVIVDAIAIAKNCSMRSVTYKWNIEGKDYSGGGWACDTTCPSMAMGREVRLRVLPDHPRTVQCTPTDISSIVGPPSYSTAAFVPGFLALILGSLLWPAFKWQRSQKDRTPPAECADGA